MRGNLAPSLYSDPEKLKGNNSCRRDPLSSLNLTESTVLPGSSVSSNDDTIGDDGTRVSSDRNQFGWSKQHERGHCPPINVDLVPRGRMRGNLAPSLYSDHKRQKGIIFPERIPFSSSNLTESTVLPGSSV